MATIRKVIPSYKKTRWAKKLKQGKCTTDKSFLLLYTIMCTGGRDTTHSHPQTAPSDRRHIVRNMGFAASSPLALPFHHLMMLCGCFSGQAAMLPPSFLKMRPYILQIHHEPMKPQRPLSPKVSTTPFGSSSSNRTHYRDDLPLSGGSNPLTSCSREVTTPNTDYGSEITMMEVGDDYGK